MLHCGIKPVVVEALDEIMPNLPRIIAMNLREKMISDGSDVIIKKYVKKLTQTDRIHAELSDGTVIDTDLVILCTGVRPWTELASAAGVVIGERGGILTNERMETNVKDIYAAGDVVEKTNLITGKKVLMPLAGPANREGRAAGCNMAGGDMIFKGVIGSSVVGFNGFVTAQTGLTYEQALAAGFDAEYVYTEDVNTSSYYPGHGYIFMMTIYAKKTAGCSGFPPAVPTARRRGRMRRLSPSMRGLLFMTSNILNSATLHHLPRRKTTLTSPDLLPRTVSARQVTPLHRSLFMKKSKRAKNSNFSTCVQLRSTRHTP